VINFTLLLGNPTSLPARFLKFFKGLKKKLQFGRQNLVTITNLKSPGDFCATGQGPRSRNWLRIFEGARHCLHVFESRFAKVYGLLVSAGTVAVYLNQMPQVVICATGTTIAMEFNLLGTPILWHGNNEFHGSPDNYGFLWNHAIWLVRRSKSISAIEADTLLPN